MLINKGTDPFYFDHAFVITTFSEVFPYIQTLVYVTPQDTPQESPQVQQLISILGQSKQSIKQELSREQLQSALNLSDRKSFRQRYLKPALEKELIEMTLPDKPNSSLQKYRLTNSGRKYAKKWGGVFLNPAISNLDQ